eukprot:1156336-Pelagomonas_calceolata.AAC.4
MNLCVCACECASLIHKPLFACDIPRQPDSHTLCCACCNEQTPSKPQSAEGTDRDGLLQSLGQQHTRSDDWHQQQRNGGLSA